jgi:hypothetical protein
VGIVRVIVKLRKVQSDRVYGVEREFAEITEPTKLDREHFYRHGTTQVKSVKPGLHMTSKQTRSTSLAIGKRTTTTSAYEIRQFGQNPVAQYGTRNPHTNGGGNPTDCTNGHGYRYAGRRPELVDLGCRKSFAL